MWALWLNTIVCLVGAPLGIFIASGSTISIANMQVPWAAALLVMAFGVPVAFAVSGIGAWLVHLFGALHLVSYFIALPWVYLAAFIMAMLATFSFLS